MQQLRKPKYMAFANHFLHSIIWKRNRRTKFLPVKMHLFSTLFNKGNPLRICIIQDSLFCICHCHAAHINIINIGIGQQLIPIGEITNQVADHQQYHQHQYNNQGNFSAVPRNSCPLPIITLRLLGLTGSAISVRIVIWWHRCITAATYIPLCFCSRCRRCFIGINPLRSGCNRSFNLPELFCLCFSSRTRHGLSSIAVAVSAGRTAACGHVRNPLMFRSLLLFLSGSHLSAV